MKMTESEFHYVKWVNHELFKTDHISSCFASFMGDDISYFQEKLKDLQICFYRPSYKSKQNFLVYLGQAGIDLKTQILQYLFQLIGKNVQSISIQKGLYYPDSKEGKYLEKTFGSLFLNSYDSRYLFSKPFSSYIIDQSKFMKELEEKKNLFLEIQRYYRQTIATVACPNLPIPQVVCCLSKQKQDMNVWKKLAISKESVQFGNNVAACFASCNGNHIFLPFCTSLYTLFHELSHFFYTDISIKFPKFYTSFLTDLYTVGLTYGVIDSEYYFSIEALTDYIAIQSMKCSAHSFSNYPYLLHMRSSYAVLLPFVQLFWKEFSPFISYYMKEQRSDTLKTILGEAYIQFLLFLEKYYNQYRNRVPSEEELNYVKNLISRMKSYLKTHSGGYYDLTVNYIDMLKKSGKMVRVLTPSMDKLRKEEQIISSTLKD